MSARMVTDNVPHAAAAVLAGAVIVDFQTDSASGRAVVVLTGVPAGFEERLCAGAIRVEPLAFSRLTRELFSRIRARARHRR